MTLLALIVLPILTGGTFYLIGRMQGTVETREVPVLITEDLFRELVPLKNGRRLGVIDHQGRKEFAFMESGNDKVFLSDHNAIFYDEDDTLGEYKCAAWRAVYTVGYGTLKWEKSYDIRIRTKKPTAPPSLDIKVDPSLPHM